MKHFEIKNHGKKYHLYKFGVVVWKYDSLKEAKAGLDVFKNYSEAQTYLSNKLGELITSVSYKYDIDRHIIRELISAMASN